MTSARSSVTIVRLTVSRWTRPADRSPDLATGGPDTEETPWEPPPNRSGSHLRKLWSDHVIWTREYIVAAVAGTPDADAAAGRLLKNQEDIGAAIGPFYGQAAATS